MPGEIPSTPPPTQKIPIQQTGTKKGFTEFASDSFVILQKLESGLITKKDLQSEKPSEDAKDLLKAIKTNIEKLKSIVDSKDLSNKKSVINLLLSFLNTHSENSAHLFDKTKIAKLKTELEHAGIKNDNTSFTLWKNQVEKSRLPSPISLASPHEKIKDENESFVTNDPSKGNIISLATSSPSAFSSSSNSTIPPGPPLSSNMRNPRTIPLPSSSEYATFNDTLKQISNGTNVDENRKLLQEEMRELQPNLGTIDPTSLGTVKTGMVNPMGEITSWNLPPSNMAWDTTKDGPIPINAWYEPMLNKVIETPDNQKNQPAVILGPNNARETDNGLSFTIPIGTNYNSAISSWSPSVTPKESSKIFFSSDEISSNFSDYTLSAHNSTGETLGNQAIRYHREASDNPEKFYDSYLVKGSAWVANNYKNVPPKISFDKEIKAFIPISQSPDSTTYHYKVVVTDSSSQQPLPDTSFLLSSSIPLNIQDNTITSDSNQDLSNVWINYAAIPVNEDYRNENFSPINDDAAEKTLWANADFFATSSQSSVIGTTRAVSFRGVDGQGNPSNGSLLFALPVTRQETLVQIEGVSPTEQKNDLVFETLLGGLRAVTSQTGVFFFQDPLLAENQSEALGPMSALTDTQVIPKAILDKMDITTAQNLLQTALTSIADTKSRYADSQSVNNNTYYTGKIVWDEAILLQEASLLSDKLGSHVPAGTNETIANFSNNVKSHLNLLFNNLRYDTDFSQIVMGAVDKNNYLGNDHSTISGYLGNAATLFTKYELSHGTSVQNLWMNQKVANKQITNGKVVDLLLQDVLNPTANPYFVSMQSSNPYDGNIWQSGKGMTNVSPGNTTDYTEHYIIGRTLSEDKENINAVFFMQSLGEIKQTLAQVNGDQALKVQGQKLENLANVMLLEQRKFEQTIMQNPDTYLPNSQITKEGQVVNIVTDSGVFANTYFGDDVYCRTGEPNLVPSLQMMLLTSLDDNGKPTAFTKQISDKVEPMLKDGSFWSWSNNIMSTALMPYALMHPDEIPAIINNYQTIIIPKVKESQSLVYSVRGDSWNFLQDLQKKITSITPENRTPINLSQLPSHQSLISNLENLKQKIINQNIPMSQAIANTATGFENAISKIVAAYDSYDSIIMEINNNSPTPDQTNRLNAAINTLKTSYSNEATNGIIWGNYEGLNFHFQNSWFDTSFDPTTLALVPELVKSLNTSQSY